MRRSFECVGVALLVVFGCTSVVMAQGTAENFSQASAPDVLAYWTPERMADARPANPELPGQPSPPAEGPALPTGPPGAVSGSPGGDWLLVEVDEATLVEFAQSVELPLGYTYPPPENTWAIPVPWYGSYPIRTVGKVYYTQNAINYVASGSSQGGRSVLTAGHVVSDGSGNWSSNVTFIPALRGTWKPYGTWVGDGWMLVASAWHTGNNWCRDVAFFAVLDQGGLTLSQRVGHLGYAWNWSVTRAWTGLGYPTVGWSGAIMVATNASNSKTDAPSACTPATMGMGTRQTPGCSGGPWIWRYRAQQFSLNYTNGVFSYYYGATPLEFFSPYFDTWVHDALIIPALAH